MDQSRAESPPPAITTVLSLNSLGSFIMYNIPLSSKSVILEMLGFLGVNVPRPPAIAITLARISVPLSVVTLKEPS